MTEANSPSTLTVSVHHLQLAQSNDLAINCFTCSNEIHESIRVNTSIVSRFLVLLLLCVVPLQVTYAAVARYCSHDEQGASASHLGHHSHKHVSQNDDTKAPLDAADLDCGLHQLASAQVVLPSLVQAIVVVAGRYALPPADQLRSFILNGPLRPPLVASFA